MITVRLIYQKYLIQADRKSLGSVTLPIPNGIKDADKVEWGSDSMNAGELALASIAYAAIGGDVHDELKKVMSGLGGISGGIAQRVRNRFMGVD